MVVNLSDRIKMINRSAHLAQDTQTSAPAPVDELKDGIRCIRSVSDEELEEVLLQPEPATIDDVLAQLKKLTKAIEAQSLEIKKINKHVNATQKELKKTKKD